MRWIGSLMTWCMAALLGAAVALPSQATTIRYDLNLVGGTTWQYDFSVSNDSLAGSIKEFTIYFDGPLFSNLQLFSTPAGWDPIAIQPDPGLPQAGFFDWLATGSGIAAGQSFGVFKVRVDFAGNAKPGNSLFEIVDPTTFATLDRGFTTPAVVAAVPEPGTIALLASGFALTALGARRRARKGNAPA